VGATANDDGGSGPGGASRRRLLLAGAAALLLIAGIAALLGKAAGYTRLLHELRSADPRWLLLAFAAEALCFAGYITALRAVTGFEAGPVVSVRDAAHLAFATLGAQRLFVGGGAGALALDYWALQKAGARKAEAAARVLALNLLLVAAVWAGTWLAALALTLAEPSRAPLHLTLPWLLAVPGLFGLVRLVRAPQPRHGLGRPGAWLARSLTTVAASFTLVRRLVARPRRNALALAAAAVDWIGDAACLWAGLRAFGIAIDPGRLLLAYGTASLVALLPLPLGGIGTMEAVLAGTVRAVGVPLAPALLGVLAYRLFNYWLPTIPGIAAFIGLPRLGARLAGGRRGPKAERRRASGRRPRQ